MSSIEWTERTWNPIAGCSVVSPGCTNCYAMRMAHRLESMGSAPHYAGTTEMSRGGPVWTGKIGVAPERALTAPLHRRKPTVYFVNSMSDLFHEAVPDEVIDRVFAVMALCPQHKFQVLTKRAARLREYMGRRESFGRHPSMVHAAIMAATGRWSTPALDLRAWPLPNVWLGVSAEDQRRADERVPHLLATPAAVRFVSAEPLLGPVDLHQWLHPSGAAGQCVSIDGDWCHEPGTCSCCRRGLDWVIVGGESGPGARPMHPDWARSLRDQCTAAGVAFFFKQWGAWAAVRREGPDDASNVTIWPDGKVGSGSANANGGVGRQVQRVGKRAAGRLLDGRTWDQVPA
ncbi:DUF5131 family protein [Roseivivax isoporae]|uniref:Phage Gp37Gp68 n=1 Tax=Roseivivax isoporae LMG 25204 TaxID=1449351 RepID=X7F1L0_9RHOB|nr:phage Gp37/Gp68 family protein [Roseivivax isoporae]ETX26623.1 hypothetical protein RISW2_21755 [Roseivivax isoporae LMG 25204]